MNIRQAVRNDISAIYQLGKAVEEFSVNNETVAFWPEELLAQAVTSPDVLILVAEENEIIFGFILTNYSHGLKKAIIENVYVHRDKRGQGISDKLLHQAIKLLHEKGCEYLATLVPPDAQGAIDLYTRNGFHLGERFIWLDRSLNNRFTRR